MCLIKILFSIKLGGLSRKARALYFIWLQRYLCSEKLKFKIAFLCLKNYWQVCLENPVLFWLSCSGCPFLTVLFLTACSGCLLLAVLFWLTFPGSHILAVLSLYSFPDCPISGCPLPAWLVLSVLRLLSSAGCPVLFWLSCFSTKFCIGSLLEFRGYQISVKSLIRWPT